MADPIDPLPTPPNRGMQDREEFVVVTDAFLASLPNLVTQINAFSEDENERIQQAFSGSFSYSMAIGTGAKSFTGAPGLAFIPGHTVVVAATSSPANSMTGTITAYDPVTGVTFMNVPVGGTAGSGTFSDWSIGFAVTADLSGYVTLTSAQTLTNKTFTTPVLSGTASGTTAGRLGYASGVFSYGDGSVQRVVANLNEAQTFTNKTFTSPAINGGTVASAAMTAPTVTDYTETVASTTGSALTVNLANGTQHRLTTNANATVTLPTPVAGKSFVLTVDYGGAHTLSFAGGTRRWSNGVVPTPTGVNGKRDVYAFNCVDGTAWDSFQSGVNL